jgi:hypothetical protein
MAGFFPHTGGAPVGYTALPQTTFNGFLDSIVNDLGAGVNGWSLWDDQRVSGSTYPLIGLAGLIDGNFMSSSNCSFTIPNASSNVSIVRNDYGASPQNHWAPGSASISVDQTNWYTPNSYTLSSFTWTVVLDRNYTGATLTSKRDPIYEKFTSYIVLKCTSTQKTFYVSVARTNGYGSLCRIRIWETWNNSTHVGTNPSNEEVIRAYHNQQYPTTPIQYIAWFLPDVFALYAGAGAWNPILSPAPAGNDGNYTSFTDFAYVGNLDTTGLRVSDGDALLWACSNQALSGYGAAFNAAYNTANVTWGGAQILRTLQGNVWMHPMYINNNSATNGTSIFPRGLSYIWVADKTALDLGARMQFCEFDAYVLGAGSSGNATSEGKRGTLRYIKCPAMNPSGLGFSTFGPADDGNTYMLVGASRATYMGAPKVNGVKETGQGNHTWSGFSFSSKFALTVLGEIYSDNTSVFTHRHFLMPINV